MALFVLCVCLVARPDRTLAQTDSLLATFPAQSSLAFPPALQADHAAERHETDVDDRAQRYANSTAHRIALFPVTLLKLPLWLLNYPLEHWLVRRHPPAPVEAALFRAQILLQSGYSFRYGGFGVGSGVGGGISYRGLLPGSSYTYGKFFVGATFSGYQQYVLQLERKFGDRTTVFARTQFLDEPRIEFYGVGLHSDEADRSSYRLLSTSADVSGQTSFRRHSFVSWSVGYAHRTPRHGLSPGIPNSAAVFSADAVEGLRGDFDLLQYGVGIGLDGRDNPSYARRGTYANASLRFTHGVGTSDALAYTHGIVELQQFVPLPGARRTLAMRLGTVVSVDQSADGRDMPVWSLQQLGGGTSLRSLQNFRYADEELLIANFEYRFPFWFLEHQSGVAIDALTFFDVGTVLPNLGLLQQRDLRSGAGFGFRGVLHGNTLFKLDIGWTSDNFKIDAGVRGPL